MMIVINFTSEKIHCRYFHIDDDFCKDNKLRKFYEDNFLDIKIIQLIARLIISIIEMACHLVISFLSNCKSFSNSLFNTFNL